MEIVTLVFILTSAVIILTPGQDMILVMSRSIAQGQKLELSQHLELVLDY
jgi:threonine/homoserine/homoserine lactone efflux protein